MNVRSRFAPSPTGYLHLGGARTALYCWLHARKNQGKFILRIEDTDLARSTPEATQAILDSMRWLGMDWDEGPYYQTQRFERYAEVIQQLLASGKAYRCYCSKERLDELRENQLKNKEHSKYDGKCRELKAEANAEENAPYVIRFRSPQTGTVQFEDIVRGEVNIENAQLDDFIIARTDGTPTYNFTVVVDDIDMRITEVIRGEDHIANTPKQINIFKALDAIIPRFAHIPMILNESGEKLSKRHGAASVYEYRIEGILREALLNYLVRLGWSHGDQEIFSIKELQELFDVNDINKSAASINPEKLLWLNQHYMKTLPTDEVAKELAWQFEQLGVDVSGGPSLTEVVVAQCERVKTLREMAERSRYFFEDFEQIDETAAKKHLRPVILEPLAATKEALAQLDNWNKEAIQQTINVSAEKFSIKLGKIAQPIRVAVTGNTVSPSIDQTLELIGKAKTVERLEKAISLIASR